jgi:hypothetical protein
MNRVLESFTVDQPLITRDKDRSNHVKNNIWVYIICLIAAGLHIYPLTFPVLIGGDEATHLHGGLGIYVYINNYWSSFFDLPIQYAVWVLAGLIFLLIKRNRIINFLSGPLNTIYLSIGKPNKLSGFFLVLLFFGLLLGYFFLLQDLPFHPLLIRYPPLSKLLYLGSYLFLGINQAGPRIVQVLFYVLTALYLYRTISLFKNKETALLGASIYLFSPLVFSFANYAELASGTIFFVILISYYFLRFVKDGDPRALLLTSYFMSIGFLYKRNVFLMFFICIFYLFAIKLKNKYFHLLKPLKILLLSLIPIVPWLILGKYYIYRNYEIIWSHLISPDMLVSYATVIPSQVSWLVFFLFLCSVILFLFSKKDTLPLFFGLIFLFHYLFYVSDATAQSYTSKITVGVHRFSMVFYPTIAVFVAQFLYRIVQNIKWKHSFRLTFFILTIYLITICTVWQVSPVNSQFVSYRNIESHYFPSPQAMKWVKDNVKEGEKILILRVASSIFYGDKYNIDRNKIIDFWHNLKEVSTPRQLKTFIRSNNISYIMFPYGPHHLMGHDIIEYLKSNSGNEFTEAEKFTMGGNYIFIYKIQHISDLSSDNPNSPQ